VGGGRREEEAGEDGSDASSSLPLNAQAPVRRPIPPLPRTRRTRRYKNGDAYFPPKLVVFEGNYYKTMDHFLTLVAEKFERYGPLRKLYTTEGRRIKVLTEMKSGESYVVTKSERFQRLAYSEIVSDSIRDMKRRRDYLQKKQAGVDPKIPTAEVLEKLRHRWEQKPNIQRRFSKLTVDDSIKIHLLRNGIPQHDKRHRYSQLILAKRNMISLDQVCHRVAAKWELHCPCHKLYTLAGVQIRFIEELEYS